jgi:hypothetical protein
MAFKLNRSHNDYFYWIYPVIFIGLTFYAIIRDRQDREHAARPEILINADSSVIKGTQTGMSDSLSTKENLLDLSIPHATDR